MNRAKQYLRIVIKHKPALAKMAQSASQPQDAPVSLPSTLSPQNVI